LKRPYVDEGGGPMSLARRTAITNEYTAIIPAMTTGIKHYQLVNKCFFLLLRYLAFMIRSGLNVPTPEMPIPAFAVPYAAPAPK
jgi:hypothetical protein